MTTKNVFEQLCAMYVATSTKLVLVATYKNDLSSIGGGVHYFLE